MAEVMLLIDGTAPLIVKSDRSANVFDPLKQRLDEFTGKRKKTLEDHEMIARIEFELGLYYDSELGPVMPTGNVNKCLYEAAKKSKDGPKVKEGLTPLEVAVPILYKGPRTIEDLYADKEHVYTVSVGIGQRRTSRTRPIFREWALKVPFFTDEARLDFHELQRFANVAGQYIGLGERRPMFGRFQVTVTEEGAGNGKPVRATRREAALA
jgi:hypothetical protein